MNLINVPPTLARIRTTAVRLTAIACCAALLAAISGCVSKYDEIGRKKLKPDEIARMRISVTRTNYHGWEDSLVMSNGKVDVVIVPAIGRIMQFRFKGEADGPFWENRALDGKPPDPQSKEWINFGGDKTWPAPEADWNAITGRAWPPPHAFDSMPAKAEVDGWLVTLVSPVDPHFGIRTLRDIRLDPEKPVMTVTTIYEKVSGPPSRVSVWVITQLKDPVAAYAPVGASRAGEPYVMIGKEKPLDLKVGDGLISLRRDTKNPSKIGCEAGTLVWVGEREIVRIDSSRVRGDYPDQGSSAEIYTNPDPNAYIELEMLGPLATLKPGDRIERKSTYTLQRRTGIDPKREVQELLRD